MSTPNQQPPRPAGAATAGSAFQAFFSIRKRKIVQIVILCVLVALAGSAGYLLHPNPGPTPSESQVPSFIPLPAHANLVRLESYLDDHVQNWYYTIPQLSEDGGLAFFQAQLPQKGWRCITWMKNTNMSFYSQALSGTGVYLTALRGTTKAQIYLGDQDYGAWLLQDDLPDGNIGLKVSLEPSESSPCPAGAGAQLPLEGEKGHEVVEQSCLEWLPRSHNK